MRTSLRLALIACIAFAAALAGVYAARVVGDPPRKSESELHAFLHKDLELAPEQAARIERIEARFASRKMALEREMRLANARLAEAIQLEHGYGPKVTTAVDHVHHVMGNMQKETLEHLFEMRSVLNAEQAARFDKVVVKALTVDAR